MTFGLRVLDLEFRVEGEGFEVKGLNQTEKSMGK